MQQLRTALKGNTSAKNSHGDEEDRGTGIGHLEIYISLGRVLLAGMGRPYVCVFWARPVRQAFIHPPRRTRRRGSILLNFALEFNFIMCKYGKPMSH